MAPKRRPEPGLSALLVLLLALAGCRTLPPATATTSWSERCAALTAQSAYSFSGRIAARSGGQGFSAGIEWQQRGAQSLATLRGPLGIGAVNVRIDEAGISIDDGSGTSSTTAAGSTALRDLLGFEPPLREMRYWLLACGAPGVQGSETLDAGQRLAALQQGDWQLEYTQYQDVPPHVLPSRLRARHGEDSLQLAISRWRLP